MYHFVDTIYAMKKILFCRSGVQCTLSFLFRQPFHFLRQFRDHNPSHKTGHTCTNIGIFCCILSEKPLHNITQKICETTHNLGKS